LRTSRRVAIKKGWTEPAVLWCATIGESGTQRTLHVPHAAVSIVGTIQPAVLHRALGSEHRESGLLARLLLACPPRTAKRWTEKEVPTEVESAYVAMLDDLRKLEMEVDSAGQLQPVLVGLTTEAKNMFAEFVNRHGKESAELTGDLAAAYSKLEGTAARLALIFSLIDEESDVSPESMASAITVTEWFKRETRRVYGLFNEDDDDREQRQLVEWIERKGGSVTVRELTRGPRWFRGDTQGAETALAKLAKAGFGEWNVESTATNKRRLFRLVTPATATDSLETAGIRECVTVATVAGGQWASADPDNYLTNSHH